MSRRSLHKNFQTLMFIEAFKIWQIFDPMIFSRYVINTEYLNQQSASFYLNYHVHSHKNIPFRVRLQLRSFYVIRRHHALNQHHWLDWDREYQCQLLLKLYFEFVEFDWRFVLAMFQICPL